MNSYTQLRQPVPQILALVSLCFLVVDYLSAKYNGVLMNIPIYIIVMCLINLLVILISFCVFLSNRIIVIHLCGEIFYYNSIR